MLSVMGSVRNDAHVEKEGTLKKLPHVVRRIDLLHLDLGVDVAMGEEVYVGLLHL